MFSVFRSVIFSAIVAVFVATFIGCDSSTTTSCAMEITDFDVAQTSLAKGSDVSATVDLQDNTGADDLVILQNIGIYLSSNSSFDNNDTELNAFSGGSISSSGIVNYTVEIPFNIASGSYYLLAHVNSLSCSSGDNSTADTQSVQVTIQ